MDSQNSLIQKVTIINNHIYYTTIAIHIYVIQVWYPQRCREMQNCVNFPQFFPFFSIFFSHKKSHTREERASSNSSSSVEAPATTRFGHYCAFNMAAADDDEDDDEDDKDDDLRAVLSRFSVAHAYQKLLEFGVDSCEGLRLERDVKGLADDIGLSATDATALDNAQKSLLLKAKTTKETRATLREKTIQTTTTTTTTTTAAAAARDDDSDDDGKRQKNAKEDAIERAKREAKRRRENTWSDDTTHETKRTFLERALLEPDDDAPLTKSEDGHGKIEAAMAKHIEPFGETEVKIMTTLCEEKRLFALFKLPEAPVDALTGKCEWRGHPATNGNAVLLESKLMQMRLMKTKEETRDEGLEDACEKCAEEIKKATRFFSDQKVRNSILKKEVERRVEELKSEGNVDLEGGYVTATGIHYGTGAAAAAAKEAEEALYDGHGPSASSAPGARLPPSNDGAGKIDRLYDDITTETHRNNSKTIEKEGRRSDNADREVDLEAIRNKLKRKKPKFL